MIEAARKASGRGFSLLEVLIGVFFLSAIGLTMVFYLQSAAKEVGFGAEHFTAILLSQKLTEDCAQEITLNPHGFKALGFDPPSPGPAPIVDGGSVFFSMLRDRTPPWRFIHPDRDGVLDASCQPIYGQVRDFRIGVGAVRLGSAVDETVERNLYRTEIGVSWKTSTGTGQYRTQVLFGSALFPKKVLPAIPIKDSDIEKEIALAFYRDSQSTFSQLIARFGGNRDTIFALGKITVYSNAFLESPFLLRLLSDLGKWRKELKGIPPDRYDPQRFRLVTSIASSSYEIARNAFQFIHAMGPELAAVPTTFDRQNLGDQLWANSARVRGGLFQATKVYQLFLSSLVSAKESLEILLEDGMAPFQDVKRQHSTLLKTLDLYKVLSFAPGSPVSADEWRNILGFLGKHYQNRNPFMERFLREELESSASQTLSEERSPTLKVVLDSLSWKPSMDLFLRRPPE